MFFYCRWNCSLLLHTVCEHLPLVSSDPRSLLLQTSFLSILCDLLSPKKVAPYLIKVEKINQYFKRCFFITSFRISRPNQKHMKHIEFLKESRAIYRKIILVPCCIGFTLHIPYFRSTTTYQTCSHNSYAGLKAVLAPWFYSFLLKEIVPRDEYSFEGLW